MLADFFKQSKPIVFLVLGSLLSICFLFELRQVDDLSFNIETLGIYTLKFVALFGVFLVFNAVLKQFEVQKRHSLGNLYVTLFLCLCMPFLLKHQVVFALFFLSIGIYQSYHLLATNNTLTMYQMVLFFFVASLFEQSFIYLTLMASVASVLFVTPHWRLYVMPFFSISTVVILVQAYALYRFNSPLGLDFFFQKWTFDFNILNTNTEILYLVFWGIVFLFFIFQFVKVIQKRAIFHKNNAKYFLNFLLLALASQILTIPRIETLWVLSIWPFSIYIADFIWQIKSKFWKEISLWLSLMIIGVIIVFG
jgi:hypothetical protein